LSEPFSRSGIFAVGLIAATLSAIGLANAQTAPQPAMGERWVQSLKACALPLTSRCVLQAHQIYEEDHPNLVIYNHSARRDFLMIHDPDEMARRGAVSRVHQRIASNDDAHSKAGMMSTFASHLRETGRADEAKRALDEAIELALAHDVPEERDRLLVKLAEELAVSDLSKAEEMARKIGNVDRRYSQGLAAVAVVAGRAGKTREAEAIFSEIADHFLAIAHFPDRDSWWNLKFLLGRFSSENTVDRILHRLDTAPPGDAWSIRGNNRDVISFYRDLQEFKREAVMARGDFPELGADAHPKWLNRGAVLDMAKKLAQAGEFQMAQRYFNSLRFKTEWHDLYYFVEVAKAHLKREQFADAVVSLKAASASIPKSPALATYYNVRALAELLTDVLKQRDKFGLSNAEAEALGFVKCRILVDPLSRLVSPAEGALDDITTSFNLHALLIAGCDSIWVDWVSDGRLQDRASINLLNGASEVMDR
jgi:tetratricopeptide (TPR) repeat protein